MNLVRRYLPEPLKRLLRKIRGSMTPIAKRFSKPTLTYLETHLTDHCNLNCKGCGHFCPVADEWYADISQHRRDLKRLAQLFANIATIRLMGGEPLLHPAVCQFIESTRQYFPNAHLCVVTNGILLPRMTEEFWACCKTNHVTIDLTLYPPLTSRLAEYKELAELHNVPLLIREVTRFDAALNCEGNSDPQLAFKKCRERSACIFLRTGTLYVCANPALKDYANKRLGLHLTESGVDIYNPRTTGLKIIEELSKPIDNCRFCACDPIAFDWNVSRGTVAEWDVKTYRPSTVSGNPATPKE